MYTLDTLDPQELLHTLTGEASALEEQFDQLRAATSQDDESTGLAEPFPELVRSWRQRAKTSIVGSSAFGPPSKYHQDINVIIWLRENEADITLVKVIEPQADTDSTSLLELVNVYLMELNQPSAFVVGEGLSVSDRWIRSRELVLLLPSEEASAGQADALHTAHQLAEAVGVNLKIVKLPR